MMNKWLHFYVMNEVRCRLEKLQRSDAQLCERLACLGIMGAQLRTPPATPGIITTLSYIEGFKGGPLFSPIVPRDDSLSDSRCGFSQSGKFFFCSCGYSIYIYIYVQYGHRTIHPGTFRPKIGFFLNTNLT